MQRTLEYLDELFPEPKCELEFSSDFELLVAVILSAQCTDKRVNMVTKELFKKYNTPTAIFSLSQEELEKIIKPCGFYHNKAKNLISASKSLLEKFDGVVPNNQQDLMSLAGVGKKTANVVYAVGFGGDAIAVDTHVFRVSNRLGIHSKTPIECEEKLQKLIPKEKWSKVHHQLVLFGRYHCKAINPNCKECKLANVCKYYNERK